MGSESRVTVLETKGMHSILATSRIQLYFACVPISTLFTLSCLRKQLMDVNTATFSYLIVSCFVSLPSSMKFIESFTAIDIFTT
jgi:hypothetical protein